MFPSFTSLESEMFRDQLEFLVQVDQQVEEAKQVRPGEEADGAAYIQV